MLKPTVFLALFIGLIALAQNTLKLIINGQAASTQAIIVGGKTYVPLDALQKAGVKSSTASGTLNLTLPGAFQGGTEQRASLEGCLGQDLFNGIWRIKATKLEAIARDPGTLVEAPGWGLTVELRNGSKGTIAPTDTGVDGTGKGVQLAFADAQTMNADGLDVQKLTFATLPPGGVITHQIKFYYPYDVDRAKVQKPLKFLFEINPKGFEDSIKNRAGGANYTTSTPSLRVRLDCQK